MQIKEALGLGNKTVEGRKTDNARLGKKSAPPPAVTESSSGADRVEISGRSREMSKASETANSAPDVRREKIAEIKRRIENNEYKVDSQKIANKMITSFLSENF